MTRVLAISNRKGGTGKTATAVNLAAEAAASGLRVLLVDLDTQGHSGIGVGIVVRRGEATVHDLFRNDELDILSAARRTSTTGLWLLPADQQFDGTACERSPTALRRRLRGATVTSAFDLVVIDTPPAYDLLMVSGLAAADGVLVPTLPHSLSADGVRQLVRVIFQIGIRLKTPVNLVGLLPIMVGANPRHHRDVIQELTREFGPARVLTGIRTDIRVAEAFGARKPLREFASASRAGADYRSLLTELVRRGAIPSALANHEPVPGY